MIKVVLFALLVFLLQGCGDNSIIEKFDKLGKASRDMEELNTQVKSQINEIKEKYRNDVDGLKSTFSRLESKYKDDIERMEGFVRSYKAIADDKYFSLEKRYNELKNDHETLKQEVQKIKRAFEENQQSYSKMLE